MANRNVADDASNTDKTTMVSADRFMIIDSATNPDALKEITYANLKAQLDAIYQAIVLTTRGDILYYGASGLARLAAGTSGYYLKTNGAGADPAWAAGGGVVQVVNTQTGAVATGTTAMPYDDTIPQNTEGTEWMTLGITPTSATNKLKIDVVWIGTASGSDHLSVALFQDSTANALASSIQVIVSGGQMNQIHFSHYMTAGTTSATTFKVRAGDNGGGTITFNGTGGARKHGGVLASSITITEIKV